MSNFKNIKISYNKNKQLNLDDSDPVNNGNMELLIEMLEYAKEHDSTVYFAFLNYKRSVYKNYRKRNYIFYKIKSKNYYNTTDILIFETKFLPEFNSDHCNLLSNITIQNINEYNYFFKNQKMEENQKKEYINNKTKEELKQHTQANFLLDSINRSDVQIRKSRVLSDFDYAFLNKMFLL